jgi:hypothetical protein
MLPVLPGTSTEMRGTCDERLQLRIPRAHAPQGNLLSGWLVPMFTPPVVMALYFLLVQRRVAAL